MTALAAEFGCYPEPINCRAGQVEITTLPGLANRLTEPEQYLYRDDGWLFILPVQVRYSDGGGNRLFTMPKTHRILHHAADSPEHLDFHIWVLSFVLGVRLTTTERGFVDATPIRTHKLVDFVLSGRLDKAIALAESFWSANRQKPENAKRIAAVIHALFLARNPRLFQFEEFIYLYIALDTCFRLASATTDRKRPVSHSQRIEWMCNQFGLATPPWALRLGGIDAPIVKLRNETFHEGRFNGEPLGFALYGTDTGNDFMLELSALICRLLVSLLGAPNADYVRSPINTRQLHALEL
jgi:hypothetical protein